MIGLDTNILVRYLTQDDDKQWKQAVEIIESGEICFIYNVVLCEVIWVLRSKSYQFTRENISNVLEIMLQCPTFAWENRSVIYQSLQRFKQGKADFYDYLIGAIAQQFDCTITATFDQKLKSEKGFNCFE
ncbi:PIN domain-containing protein [Geminocystis herdmanii]|uniref:PIN domain-containing protein n=1 Tax=Geminocystis herdmanii TaxID=669359 RepID=UPI00036E482D|nr:type II toxin-antitoxin system VapC family toxin [Geminocystis herdmanii]